MTETEKGSVSRALFEEMEEEDEMEWEDGFIEPPSSSKNVVVEFYDSPSTSNPKKKSIRRASAEDKELAELVHKAHLLCLLARGRLVETACNDPLIQGALLSLLPSYLLIEADSSKLTANALAPLVKWFHDNFRVDCSDLQERPFPSSLASALEYRKGTAEEIAALSVALFRALNLTARFVSILDVSSLKPTADGSNLDVNGLDSGVFDSSTLMVTKSRQVSLSPGQSPSQKIGFKDGSSPIMGMTDSFGVASDVPNSSTEAHRTKAEASKRKGDLEFELQLEMAVSATAAGNQTKSKLELKDLSSGSSYHSSPQNNFKRIKIEEASVPSQGISTALGSRKVGATLHWAEIFCSAENITGKWVHVDAVNSLIGHEEKVEAATSACKRSLRYVVAFAGNGAKDVTRRYCTKWYTIASKRVSSVWWDAVLAPLKELESRSTGGVLPTHTQHETTAHEPDKLKACKASSSENAHGNQINMESMTHDSLAATRSSLEDMELQTRALTEPLPTNQQAYRNHHLYVIERWLTKYEMLRPKGPVLGYCSGHPVYPRTCVQTLLTKQRWLREGLQIKANETPAKILKHSPKRSKAQVSEPGVSTENDGEGSFALFGKWQTEPLDLPPATNGIVPKNERGQVDVWSEKCLPPGTVHLRLPRAFTVAKRLGIDYAPAMVGFEFQNGRSIPVFDGIVVCSEFQDAIIMAYAEAEEKRTEEEKKRNEAKAITRWYQLLTSILTRQRLKETYGDDSTPEMPHHLEQKEPSSVQEIPGNGANISTEGLNECISKANMTALDENHKHIFPVEDQSFDEESSVRTKRCPCGFTVEVEEF